MNLVRGVGIVHPGWLGVGILAAGAAMWLEAAAGGSRRRQSWRAGLMLLTSLALAGPRWNPQERPGTVLLVDQSASVDPAAREAALGLVDPDGRLPRLDFGDAVSSPLGQALDQASDRGHGGVLLLLGDGQWTDPAASYGPAPRRDPRLAAAGALARGWRVDVLPLAAGQLGGAALLGVRHVDRLREGDPLTLSFVLSSAAAGGGRLEVWSDARLLTTRVLDLEAGRQTTDLVLGGLATGTWTFEARLVLDGSEAATSKLRFGAVVVPPPAVLVLGDGSAPEALAAALSASGMSAAVGGWDDLSNRLSGLAEWDTVVLLDVAADRLGIDQLAALEARVREGGCGLLMTAGPSSFDAGAWKDTLLERMSPLLVDVPARRSREPVSLTFVIDRSASMGSVEGRGRIAKIDLARDAVLLASEALDPGDRVGLVAFDATAEWLLPPAVLGEGRERSEIEAVLAGLATRGGTGIGPALDLALPAVAAQAGVASRHVLLVTDGQDFNADPEALGVEVTSAERAGVTLSTIAVGREADAELLERLAASGGGRFYAAAEPSDLPALALAESRIVRSGAEQRGSFRVGPPTGPWQPLLAGVDVAKLPPLAAFRALSIRKGLRPALESSGGDPILVDWTWGLGRVAAWATGVDPEWAPGWLQSEAGRGLLAAVVRQIARPPNASPPLSYIDVRGTGLRLGLLTDGDPDPKDIVLRLDRGGGLPRERPLTQVAAGRFEAAMSVPAGDVWTAVLQTGADDRAIDLVLEAPASQEAVPGQATDDALLAAIAAVGGGRILTSAQAQETLKSEPASSWPLSHLILALVTALWGAEVAWLMRGSRAGRRLPRPDPTIQPPSSGDRT